MAPVPDHVDTVAKRRDVLAALSTPKTRPTLVEELDASRSTVDRAIDALCDHGYVERRGSEYVSTYAGREAVDAYERFRDRLDALDRAQPVLGALAATVDIDPAILEGATVVESTPSAPQAPVETNVAAIRGATAFRGTGPAVIPRYTDIVLSLVEDGGTDVELVLTEAVVDALAETYPDGLADLSRADGLALYVTDESLPYAVWTAETPDRTVSGIAVYGDNGLVGIVNNDTDAMNEWAARQYERVRREARPLD